MSTQRFVQLRDKGVSTWYDNISRDLISSGKLKSEIEKFYITGITSNPSIFQKAISSGSSYDNQIKEISAKTAQEIFEELAVLDIKDACGLLMPCYEQTKGVDGYVSLEVSPDLAYDAQGTIKEGLKLFEKLGKPNVMIKVPGTSEGFEAIEELTYQGVNINVTLLFSLESYVNSAKAYINGLKRRLSEGKEVSGISSVASFFVSRVDSAVDSALPEGDNLRGKVAIANCRLAYEEYQKIYNSSEWLDLKQKGAFPQRLLWASTSTKNPDYPDTLYVDQLIGPDTVNTMPPATMEHYYNASTEIKETLFDEKELTDSFLSELQSKGVDFAEILSKLQKDGVKQFLDSFNDLLESIEKKKGEL